MKTLDRSVFVTLAVALADTPGGVQIYTRELIGTLRLAGFELDVLGFEPDQDVITKLRRRFESNVYTNRIPPNLVGRVLKQQRRTSAKFIFLNGVDLAPLGEKLRGSNLSEDVKIVLFSYGLKSVDYLHTARARGNGNRSSALELGRELMAEMHQRKFLDLVFCLAEFETGIERWLGARNVDWIPRTIPRDQVLTWTPKGNRLGSVGTVDHWPNRDGIIRFMEEFQKLAPQSVRVRLVGGPVAEARQLCRRFSQLEYVGRLDDQALRAEAATWNCFVHPLFFYACGSSTKLATALAWQIPIVTTPAGARGYLLGKCLLPQATNPAELARLALKQLHPHAAHATRADVCAAAASSPTIEEVAGRVGAALKGLMGA